MATRAPASPWRPAPLRPGVPGGITVVERPPAGGWDGYEGPVVILVHGALDRAASFARTAIRLPEWALVTYDRRGYQGSRAAGVAAGLAVHAADLVAVAGAYAAPRTPVTAVGHSIGGSIVLGAAVTSPVTFTSAGAYEPSMPWLGVADDGWVPASRDAGLPSDPAAAAEWFFTRMAGHAAWDRLSDAGREDRRADGPALLADLASLRDGTPFDVRSLVVPTVVSAGGAASTARHRRTADWLAANVAVVHRREVPEAGHGAHLSHPDAFAQLVRTAVALATRADRAAPGRAASARTAAAGAAGA